MSRRRFGRRTQLGAGASGEPLHGLELLSRIGRGVMTVKDACLVAGTSRSHDTITAAMAELNNRATAHQERDLHAWAARQAWRKLMPQLYIFGCTKAGDGEHYGVVLPALHAALLPHEVVGCLADAGPELLAHVCGSRRTWRRFWRERARASEAAMAEPAEPSATVPLGIHGDDAGVQVPEKITIVNWGSVASPGRTHYICFGPCVRSPGQ